jgi:hypothetical protein
LERGISPARPTGGSGNTDYQNHAAAFDPISRPEGADRGRIIWPYLVAVVGFHLLLPLARKPEGGHCDVSPHLLSSEESRK